MTTVLDNKTDAGEFIYQQLWHLPTEYRSKAEKVFSHPSPTAEALAEAFGTNPNHPSPYSTIVHRLEQYGMEFESMHNRGDMTAREFGVADHGISSAIRFVNEAQRIARGGVNSEKGAATGT